MRSLLFILLFTVPIPAVAQESEPLSVDVKGFVDTYHALRSESDYDWMSSRSRVRGEVTVSKGGSTSMTYTLAAVWHSKGTNTPVYLSSFTSYWSASQPSGTYRPAFYAAAASEGLSTSRTYNPGSYTIGSSQKSGTYNINAVVGGNMGSWWVSEYSSPDSDQSGSTRGTIESGSISFSPTATSATIYAVWISSTPIS